MISAVLVRSGGKWHGFTVKGHSGSAPKGKDIICAAVSSIVQTALIGLDEVAGVKNSYEISDGFVKCELPAGLDEEAFYKASVILDVMSLGIKSIAEQYSDFVRIKED